MKTALKAAGITLAGATALLASLAIWLWASQFGALKPLVESQLSSQLGRQVAIEGDFRIAADLKPTLVAYDVSVASPNWGSRPDMIRAERIELKFELLSLLKEGRLLIQQLRLANPTILLETAGDKENWNFSSDTSHGSVPARRQSTPDFNLLNVDIRDGVITYRSNDEPNGRTLRIDRLEWESVSEADRLKLSANGRFLDRPWEVSGTVGSIADFFTFGDNYPLDLNGEIDGVNIAAEGSLRRADTGPSEPLSLVVSTSNLGDLEKWTGVSLPVMGAARVKTEIKKEGDQYWFRKMEVRLGELEATGEIGIIPGNVPQITVSLSSDEINLANLLAGQKVNNEGTGAAGPINLENMKEWFPSEDALRQFHATAQLHIGRLEMGDAGPTDVDVRVQAGNGEISVEPVRFAVGEGLVAATLLARSGDIPEVRFTADVKAVSPEQIAGWMGVDMGNPSERLSGDVLVEVRVQKDRPVFSGTMNVDELVFANSNEEKDGESTKLLSDEPVSTEWLHGYSGSFDMNIDVLRLSDLELSDVRARARVDEDSLALDPVSFVLADGTVDGKLRLEGAPILNLAKVSLNSQHFDVGRLLSDLGLGEAVVGALRIEGELEGRGSSMRELASSLKGEGSVLMREGKILDTRLNLLVADLDILRLLPFVGGGSDYIDVSCFVGGVKFDAGVGKSTIILDTPEMLLAGDGTIDLAGDRLDLTFRSKPKRQKLSTVSIPVRIHGPLAAPEVEPFEVKRNAAKGFFGGLALPLNFLSQFLPSQQSDKQACAGAIEDVDASSRQHGASETDGAQ